MFRDEQEYGGIWKRYARDPVLAKVLSDMKKLEELKRLFRCFIPDKHGCALKLERQFWIADKA